MAIYSFLDTFEPHERPLKLGCRRACLGVRPSRVAVRLLLLRLQGTCAHVLSNMCDWMPVLLVAVVGEGHADSSAISTVMWLKSVTAAQPVGADEAAPGGPYRVLREPVGLLGRIRRRVHADHRGGAFLCRRSAHGGALSAFHPAGVRHQPT